MGGVSAQRLQWHFHPHEHLQGQQRLPSSPTCLCISAGAPLRDKPPARCRGSEWPWAEARRKGQRGEWDRAVRCSSSQSVNRGDSSSPQARGRGRLGLGLMSSCEEMPPRGGTASSPRPAGSGDFSIRHKH